MSDYRDYEIRLTYNGGIYVSAIDEAEAEQIARDIMLEETNAEIAKYTTYTIERITE